jgi:hypothetical protein
VNEYGQEGVMLKKVILTKISKSEKTEWVRVGRSEFEFGFEVAHAYEIIIQ